MKTVCTLLLLWQIINFSSNYILTTTNPDFNPRWQIKSILYGFKSDVESSSVLIDIVNFYDPALYYSTFRTHCTHCLPYKSKYTSYHHQDTMSCVSGGCLHDHVSEVK